MYQTETYRRISVSKLINIFRDLGAEKVSLKFRSEDSRRSSPADHLSGMLGVSSMHHTHTRTGMALSKLSCRISSG